MRIGERLRRKCEDLDWGKITNVEGVTISLGVARYQFGYDETSLLHAADTALYFSKGAGRNRLTVADQTSPLSEGSPVGVTSR
jgi:sigma-B regulation protein RsbU (phosphoserine phosphatase)